MKRRIQPSRVFVYLLAALALLPVLAFMVLQTRPAQRELESYLNRLLSNGAMRIQLEGLSGRLPVDAHLNRLTASDRDGVWLEATGIQLRFDLKKLLKDRTCHLVLRLDELHLVRTPAKQPEKTPATRAFPVLPAIDMQALEIHHLQLPVLGTFPGFAGSLSASAQLKDTRLDARIHAANKQDDLEGSLTWNLVSAEHQLQASWTSQTAGVLSSMLSIFPHGQARLDTSGAWPETTGTIDAGVSLDLGKAPLPVTTHSHFIWKDQRLAFSNMTASAPGLAMAGQAELDSTNRMLAGSWRVQAASFESLALILTNPPAGRLEGQLHMLLTNRLLGMYLSGTGENLGWHGVTASVVQIEAACGDVVHLKDFTAQATGQDIRAASVELQSLACTAEGGWQEFSFTAAGAGSWATGMPVTATVAGWMRTSTNSISVSMDQLEGAAGAYPFRLQTPVLIRSEDGCISTKSLVASIAEANLAAAATYSATGLEVRMLLTDVNLARLPWTNLQAKGTASLQLSCQGRPQSPDLQALIQAEGACLSGHDLLATMKIEASNDLWRGSCGLEVKELGNISGTCDVPITFGLSPWSWSLPTGQTFSAAANARLDLGHLFHQETQPVRGQLDMKLSVGGSMQMPTWAGTVALTNGFYEHPGLRLTLDQINIQAHGEGDRIIIERATATDGNSGRLNGGGQLMYTTDNGLSGEVSVDLQKFAPFRRPQAEAWVSGTAKLSGNIHTQLLSGRLKLVDFSYRIPSRLPPSIVQLEYEDMDESAADAAKTNAVKTAWLPGLAFDLELLTAPDGVIQGRGIRSEWKGGLRLRGDMQNPQIAGSFKVSQGYLLFLGRRFHLDNSTLAIDGASASQVTLNFTAQSRIGDSTVRVRVVGPMDSPELLLESDPPTSTEEVVSIILFGKDTESLTAIQAVRLVQTLEMLRGRGHSFDLLARGQSILRIDQLEITQSEEHPDQTAVSAGKHIGSNLYLQGDKNIGGNGGGVSLTIELTPSIALKTESRDNGAREGISVNWKRDY